MVRITDPYQAIISTWGWTYAPLCMPLALSPYSQDSFVITNLTEYPFYVPYGYIGKDFSIAMFVDLAEYEYTTITEAHLNIRIKTGCETPGQSIRASRLLRLWDITQTFAGTNASATAEYWHRYPNLPWTTFGGDIDINYQGNARSIGSSGVITVDITSIAQLYKGANAPIIIQVTEPSLEGATRLDWDDFLGVDVAYTGTLGYGGDTDCSSGGGE
jgi:hypothetical protein